MTSFETQIFQAALEERARDLENVLNERGSIAIEGCADTLDARVLAAEREARAQVLARTTAVLRQVRGALERLRRGVFGTCARCKLQIAAKRMQAVPWTKFCLPCQVQAEHG